MYTKPKNITSSTFFRPAVICLLTLLTACSSMYQNTAEEKTSATVSDFPYAFEKVAKNKLREMADELAVG